MPTLDDYLRQADNVPGWFPAEDRQTFTQLLTRQRDAGADGRLLEIGVFHGQSAILLGYFASEEHPLIACDVFDEVSVGAANDAENALSYDGVTRLDFLGHWTRFHSPERLDLKVCLSGGLRDLVPASSVRLLHLDGSHLYDVVRDDIAMCAELLTEDGILVLDDYRSPHTPGVAAATWQAVHAGMLWPFRLTPQKMYAALSAESAKTCRSFLADDLPYGLALTRETVGESSFDVLYPSPSVEASKVELPRETLRRAGRELGSAISRGVAGVLARRGR